ncbi:hypothetical protein LTR84_007580 [Exophiala bonariae]|uniref:GPI transamidase component GAA1 n=1 Tax=Exophiala bonariae TaxID=1690606 RepID=A0AAV9NP42_9EURO|nr:hypothetical protein LTR84_007580 [Exophiala bonariae]
MSKSTQSLTWSPGNALSNLRKDDPRLRRLPPFLSFLCVLGGIAWVLLLPLNEYSRQTYISENALLPGQVHTYFGGSEQNVFRAYRHELESALDPALGANQTLTQDEIRAAEDKRNTKIQDLFRSAGLKSARQRYSFTSSGQVHEGENVHAVLHAPRGDGTEAIVVLAALRNIDDVSNLNGVTLLISLARYFKRWSLWSKDIIFLVTPDSSVGPQAWIDAYHSAHNPKYVQDLSLKSGALQGAVCIDYPFEHRFENFHIAYDGINGALPNLDLFNTAVSISTGQMGIGTTIQFQQTFTQQDKQGAYPSRVQTLMRGMSSQALGHATGPHSSFMSYHIDAITLTAIGQGWQDEMAFGRTIESICRSLNNLLEKLHQSFFFYLLMQCNRFVSIGTYLPSAMAIAASYTLMAIYLWVESGYQRVETISSKPEGKLETRLNGKDSSTKGTSVPDTNDKASTTFEPVDRQLVLPIALLTGIHLASLGPLYLLTTLGSTSLPSAFTLFSVVLPLLPVFLASSLPNGSQDPSKSATPSSTHFQYTLLKSLSLLVLGLFLTVLATLNFSLSMCLGIIATPLAMVNRTPGKPVLAVLQYALLTILSPSALFFAASFLLGNDQIQWLTRLAFGWNIWGSWGVPVGVLCIWLPAWVVGATVVASTWFKAEHESVLRVPKTP